jgi:hypothetical protein
MKTIIFLFLSPIFLFAQKTNSEGIITYSIQYEILDSNYTQVQLKQQFGDKLVCYIKDGKYKQEHLNSAGIEYVIYDNQTNLYTYKLAISDTLYQLDCSRYSDKVSIEVTDSRMEIAGYKCRKVEVQEYGPPINMLYYFAEDLYLNPKPFKRHKLAGYNKILKKVHSIYFRSETDYGPYKTILTADTIQLQKIDDAVFDLPALPRSQK